MCGIALPIRWLVRSKGSRELIIDGRRLRYHQRGRRPVAVEWPELRGVGLVVVTDRTSSDAAVRQHAPGWYLGRHSA